MTNKAHAITGCSACNNTWAEVTGYSWHYDWLNRSILTMFRGCCRRRRGDEQVTLTPRYTVVQGVQRRRKSGRRPFWAIFRIFVQGGLVFSIPTIPCPSPFHFLPVFPPYTWCGLRQSIFLSWCKKWPNMLCPSCVLSYILCVFLLGTTWLCSFFFVFFPCVFLSLSRGFPGLVVSTTPVSGSSLKWPVMCWWGTITPTH